MKEEIEVMLQRELPRIALCLNGHYYDKANPGKAFENSTFKMVTFCFQFYFMVLKFPEMKIKWVY